MRAVLPETDQDNRVARSAWRESAMPCCVMQTNQVASICLIGINQTEKS
jgi:hypothetical protein